MLRVCWVLAALVAAGTLADAAGEGGAAPAARQEAVEAFLGVVRHWQQEAWGKLYDGATARSRKVVTRSAFVSTMERTGARLSGDERAVQIVTIVSRYETLVEITAILGYRTPRPVFKREMFQMEWDEGRWRISTVAVLYADPEEVPPPPQVEH